MLETRLAEVLGQFRRLVERRQPPLVAPHEVEDARRGVRVVERRDVGLVEHVLAAAHFRPAHPTGQHRLAIGRLAGRAGELIGQGARRLGRVGHRLRCQDDQGAVAVLIVGGDLDRLGVAHGVGVAQDIDGVVVAPVGRQQLVVLLHGRVRDGGQLAAVGDQRVGGQHAGAAGVGHDGQARPARPGLLAQHLGHIEQFGDAVDAQHATAAEGGGQYFVAAGQ